MTDPSAPAAVERCLVALGASNLVRGALALCDAARARADGPVRVLAALGRGRSYGVRSSLLGRTLPGIDDCALWPALAAVPRSTTTALVMDVGNDLLYGFPPDTILRWVDDALQRLRSHADERILAGLPLPSLDRLGPRTFALVRTLLVPGCRLTLPAVARMAHEVEAGLQQLARRHDARFRPLRGAWYGLDPVHIRQRSRRAAFAELLGVVPQPVSPPCDTWPGRIGLLAARPARRWWFGIERTAAQPARRWADGTTLSLY